MLFEITKEFHFSASHRLYDLPDSHPCARLHGHNYVVRVTLGADRLTKKPDGFVMDYGELAPFAKWLKDEIDHRHLNDLMGEVNPTAENLAMWFYERLWHPGEIRMTGYGLLVAVAVSETPKTWATFRPNQREAKA